MRKVLLGIGILLLLTSIGCISEGVSKVKAIEIAKQYAMDKGQDLKSYQEPTATFNKANNTWEVSFKMEPMPPGGEFEIVVNSQTGEVLHYFLGE